MSRSKIISDAEVFAVVRRLLAAGGDKAVAFATVARATGLAAPTLVQRFASRDAMVRAALAAAWDGLDAATVVVVADAGGGEKGAAALLKALGTAHGLTLDVALLATCFRDAALRERATAWRTAVEAALTARLSGDADAAAHLFAVWQGQMLWQTVGGKGFRLKDAVRRING